MDELFGRGIAFPPRLGPDGRWAWSTGPQSVREVIQVVLLTALNERLMLPDFGAGLDDFLFEPNTATTRRLIEERVVKAIRRWEPRVKVETVSVQPDPDDARAAIVTVRYQLIATQAQEQVSLGVTLGG